MPTRSSSESLQVWDFHLPDFHSFSRHLSWNWGRTEYFRQTWKRTGPAREGGRTDRTAERRTANFSQSVASTLTVECSFLCDTVYSSENQVFVPSFKMLSQNIKYFRQERNAHITVPLIRKVAAWSRYPGGSSRTHPRVSETQVFQVPERKVHRQINISHLLRATQVSLHLGRWTCEFLINGAITTH